MKIDGLWSEDPEAIANYITSHYNALFSMNNYGNSLDYDFPLGPMLSNKDNIHITSPSLGMKLE